MVVYSSLYKASSCTCNLQFIIYKDSSLSSMTLQKRFRISWPNRYKTTGLAHYFQLWTIVHNLKQESSQSVNDFLLRFNRFGIKYLRRKSVKIIFILFKFSWLFDPNMKLSESLFTTTTSSSYIGYGYTRNHFRRDSPQS